MKMVCAVKVTGENYNEGMPVTQYSFEVLIFNDLCW